MSDSTRKLARIGLVVLATGQVVSAFLAQRYGGQFTTENRAGEPPITPAGYTFAIWGLVEVLSVAYAIWAMHTRRLASREQEALRDRLTLPLLVVFAGFSVWLAAAELEPAWATLAVFLVIMAALLWAIRIVLSSRSAFASWGPAPRVLLGALLGVYAGWSSVAVWLNLTTALAFSGAPVTGPVGVGGQLGILGATIGTATLVLWWTRAEPYLTLPYAAAVAWAYVGVIVGTIEAAQHALAVTAGVGLGFVVAFVLGGLGRTAAALDRPLG